jgi:hypothetical protein
VKCADPGVCEQAVCDPAKGCVVSPMPDGTLCTLNDVCAGAGACHGGACEPATVAGLATDDTRGAAGATSLGVTRFTLKQVGRKLRLMAQGSFPYHGAIDISAGVTIELRDQSGNVLYTATVPGNEFSGSGFRLVYAGGRGPDHNGLRRLELRGDGGMAEVRVRAYVPTTLDAALPVVTGGATRLAPAAGGNQLAWVVRVAQKCARDSGLVCGQKKGNARQCR